ncbi:competence protein ComK [Oceanobacillus longus]|uniref:Competence protein ComK n=1 Tax=Oceanobacillus longus TaxID=930120 RepID=A0ABV8GZ77_9BACI
MGVRHLHFLDNCSTYEGRTTAVKHHFGFKRKIPLPIDPATNIYV